MRMIIGLNKILEVEEKKTPGVVARSVTSLNDVYVVHCGSCYTKMYIIGKPAISQRVYCYKCHEVSEIAEIITFCTDKKQ